eukprot:6182651-Pleurochrysis_carterae.AAC.3
MGVAADAILPLVRAGSVWCSTTSVETEARATAGPVDSAAARALFLAAKPTYSIVRYNSTPKLHQLIAIVIAGAGLDPTTILVQVLRGH